MKRLIRNSVVVLTVLLSSTSSLLVSAAESKADGSKATVFLRATNAKGAPILKNDIKWTIIRTDGGSGRDREFNRHTVWFDLEAGRYTAIAERKGIKHKRDFHVFANTRNHIAVPVQ